MNDVWNCVVATVVLYQLCLFLQLVERSIAVCREECSNAPQMHIWMRRGKTTTLCLNYQHYRLLDISVLDSTCDSLDDEDPSTNATYNCSVVNVTMQTLLSGGENMQFCEQLVTIECVHTIPVAVKDDSDDCGEEGERECRGSSDSGDSDGRGGGDDGHGGIDDTSSEDDLVLGLLMGSTKQQFTCQVFIYVTMIDSSIDDSDLCDEITSNNFDFCMAVCINHTLDNAEICSDLADSILDKTTVGDDDLDDVFEILRAVSTPSGSVSSLNSTVQIIGNLINMLAIHPSLINADRGQVLTAIIDETLSEMRSGDWQTLQQGAGQYQSSNLLSSLETISLALSNVVRNQSDFFYRGSSIQMLAIERVSEEDVQSGFYHFPASTDINGLARLEIPRKVLCSSRSPERGDTDEMDHAGGCSAVVSAAIVQNLPNYLDQTDSTSSNYRTNSLLMSVSVQKSDKDIDIGNLLQDFPAVIYFTARNQNTSFGDSDCVFWNFTTRRWSNDGLTTLKETDSNVIRCVSTHLTSFAVLVDVNGQGEGGNEAYALKLVSYAGCVVSLVCLALSLLILISCGKQLKKGVLLYIHINFIIALGLALLLFVTGIETAAKIRELCAAVTALLHYLFLCVFCWMLAEAIMLYLLVVRIFGTAASKWYYLLTLGWGLPIPIVVISAGVRFDDYGKGDFCWLPTTSGTVWSFIGPMIAIIMVNSIVLVLTLRSLLQGKKFRQSTSTHRTTKLMLVWSALKSTSILLPLLGVTWIIGVLAINENTTVFAWLFTILNSLQGFFIFVFHVLRNDKVWSSVKQAFRHPFRCCSYEVANRQGSMIKHSKSNSVTMTTTNTNCQDCEQGSESTDHPIIIGRSYSETSQDSTLELANYLMTLQQN